MIQQVFSYCQGYGFKVWSLNGYIFRHNFKDALILICDRGSETETTDHFFLRCPFFVINRQKLLNGLFKMDLSVRNLKEELLLDIILYGSAKYRDTANKYILFHTISFIKTPNALKDHCLTTDLLLYYYYYHFFP